MPSNTSIVLDEGTLGIADYAFYFYKNLVSISIPNSVTNIGNWAFYCCSNLASFSIPNSLTSIGYQAFLGTKWLNNQTSWLVYVGKVAYKNRDGSTSIVLDEGTTGIASGAFEGSRLKSITIPNSVTDIGIWAFHFCPLESVKVLSATPPHIEDEAFPDYTIPLYVPKGTVEAYKSAEGWNKFTTIISEPESITLSSVGKGTYCSTNDLDFADVSGLKAYIASGYDHQTGNILLTRVTKVPAGTGIMLMGEPGTYQVPCTTVDYSYANLFVGITTPQDVPTTENGCTNYILFNGPDGVLFYQSSGEGQLGANRAYLQVPNTGALARKKLGMVTDDGLELTDINDIEPEEAPAAYYNLQGQRMKKPRRGLNIINGKKVLFRY